MGVILGLVLALQAPLLPVYVKVSASYRPPARGADPAVAVLFTPADVNITVNEDPAPRLKLDAAQEVLAEKPSPARKAATPPGKPRYLDTLVPVTFPVKLGARAARGDHTVKATVTYFYCSKSEGWCRKGTADVDVPVRIP
jgi:hypothetical protein